MSDFIQFDGFALRSEDVFCILSREAAQKGGKLYQNGYLADVPEWGKTLVYSRYGLFWSRLEIDELFPRHQVPGEEPPAGMVRIIRIQ